MQLFKKEKIEGVVISPPQMMMDFFNIVEYEEQWKKHILRSKV
jgi:hypothetical protein